MSDNQLNAADIETILDALRHAKMKYEQTEYPDREFRRKQLERAENAEKKIRALQAEITKQ